MRRRIPAALALSLAVSCGHLQPAPDPLEAFAERVDATRTALRIPGLSVAVVQGGKIALARGYGLADVEAGTPAGADTLYSIGSITKTFTSTLMMQLAEEGRLDLDLDVKRFVDFQVPPDVRIRHVLSHTSETGPGARFSYSSRFNWLDNVVESATREKFVDLMTARVLQRADLTRTLPDRSEEGYAESLAGLARPYRLEDGSIVRSKYPPMGFHSSSGLSSTVTDLAQYSMALDDGRLLSGAARERAWSPVISTRGETLPYGFGWFTQTVGGERVVWHQGWWPEAYSALLVKVPSRGLTLVLLANSEALVAPQGGAPNVLLYPMANDFLRTFVGGAHEGTRLVADALTERFRGDRARSDALLRQAVHCCSSELASVRDDDRLALFGQSGDPVVRQLGVDAGHRLVALYPEDLGIQFSLGMMVGRIRPAMRINGPESEEALTIFNRIVESPRSKPRWMEAWSSYFVAEAIAGRDRERAKTLAERALATGVDTEGLKARIEELLRRL